MELKISAETITLTCERD